MLSGLFAAALGFPGSRLPEVFAGHARGRRRSPVPYPVACNPQAWAAGSLPYMLATVLGLHPDAPGGRLHIRRPVLPAWLDRVRVAGVRVGQTTLALEFHRAGTRTRWRAVVESGPGLAIAGSEAGSMPPAVGEG